MLKKRRDAIVVKDHAVQACDKVGRLFRRREGRKDDSVKGQDGHEVCTGYQLHGISGDDAHPLAGMVEHDQVAWFVLQMHGQVAVKLIPL